MAARAAKEARLEAERDGLELPRHFPPQWRRWRRNPKVAATLAAQARILAARRAFREE